MSEEQKKEGISTRDVINSTRILSKNVKDYAGSGILITITDLEDYVVLPATLIDGHDAPELWENIRVVQLTQARLRQATLATETVQLDEAIDDLEKAE